jgi:glycopeptide antibiotics resistance protein
MKRSIILLLLVYGLCILYWMFLGFGRSHSNLYGEISYNVRPFHTIGNYIMNDHHYNFNTWFINIFGNIGIFAPYGFFIPGLFKWFRIYARFISLFVAIIFVLELLQMVLRVGSFDVDDIILNSLGVTLGFVVYKFIWWR